MFLYFNFFVFLGFVILLSFFCYKRWHWLYEGGLTPRAAHSAIYSSETDSLYVFGGYDLNHILGDLMVFRFNTSNWEDENGTPISKLI